MTLDMAQLYVDTSAHLEAYFGQRLPEGQRHLAEDMVMSVFERAIRAADRYVPHVKGPRPWLFRIAHNLLIDQQRAWQARSSTLTLDGFDNPDLDGWLAVPDRDLEGVADRLAVASLVATLPESQRPVIEARFLADLSEKETAARLGATLEGVKKRQHRALKQLRKTMEAA